MSDLASDIARLETLSPAGLRECWTTVTGTVVPNVSPSLLRLALAWEIQAKALGGLSRNMTRTLDQLAHGQTRTSPVQAGMRLVREWGDRYDDGGISGVLSV